MLCSTIIPTINRPSLERAVKSVLTQDLAPHLHEVIVVNDSGKPLPDVAWLRSPLVTVLNTNCCERSVACNVGAAVARGKYVKILHDDDYLLPGALRALTTIATTSGCDWVYGALNRVDNADNWMSVDRPTDRGNILATLVSGECLHPGASLIRREAFWRVGGFDPQLRVREDYDLECRLALTSDFDRTNELVVAVRIGREGSTTRWEQVRVEHRIVREKTLSAPQAMARILASIQANTFLRGRVCRVYLFSTVLNLQAGRLFTACWRWFVLLWLAGFYVLAPDFWRGAVFKTHWHSFEQQKEAQHYASQSAKQAEAGTLQTQSGSEPLNPERMVANQS